MKHTLYLLYAAVTLAVACSGIPKEEERLLKEAATIHNSAFDKAGELEEMLENLKSDTTVIADSVEILLKAIEAWESQMVEVPGNEHHHDHAEEGEEHHHHHEHGKTLDVTAQEMLTVQQEMKRQIEAIQVRIENLTSK
jgi:hypothetical protein